MTTDGGKIDGWKRVLRLTAIALAYIVAHKLSELFLDPVENISAIWLASGLVLAVLLINPHQLRPAIIVIVAALNFLLNFSSTGSIPASLGFLSADVLEFTIGIFVFTRLCGPQIRFTRLREVLVLIAVATLVNGCTAIVGATTTVLSSGASFWAAYITWWISNGLGILLITPFIVTWANFRFSRSRFRWDRTIEIAAFALMWCLTGWLRYRTGGGTGAFSPHPYMLVVLLVWAAMRFGLRGVSSALTVLGVIAVSGVLADIGPFILGGRTPTERLLMIQAYLGVSGIATLLLAASLTEARQAVQSLLASETLLRQFIKHTPAAVAMFDKELRYLEASDRWITAYRLEGQNIIGKSHYEVFPEIPERWKEIHRRTLAGAIERCDEDPFLRADGSLEWLQWEIRPWHTADGAIGGVIMFTQSITERKRAEETLQQSEERFRQVVENIQEVFWMTDVDKNRILYVSPGYEKIWGRSCESLYEASFTWIEAIHPDDRDRVARAALKQHEGDYFEEYRILRPDGAVRWIRDRAVPIRNGDGSVYRIAGVAEDITEQRRIEEQLRQSQKMEAIGQMAGGVAHDFNNILGAIMMQAGLAAAHKHVPPEVKDLLADLIASAERAANLTRQLLAFGRRQVMQPRLLNLNEVIEIVTKMLQRILGETSSMQLRLSTQPLMVYADEGMLDQVLVNLTVNARDAMPQGGRLLIETDSVEISEEDAPSRSELAPGRFVRLRVSDTGYGIPEEHLPRIFDPFFTTKEPGKGTGLGLATVFGIVKQHRGSIQVSSKPGRGTEFEILLPASEAAHQLQSEEIVQEPPRGGAETILLVEDDPAVRKLTQLVLEQHGYNILGASNGIEALEIWKRHNAAINLLLTDLVLPEGMNGHQIAEQLQEKKPDLKVIFTSGYSPDLAGRELKLKEGQNFLPKPCRPHQILDTVRRALDDR